MKQIFKVIKITLFLLLTISCKNEVKERGTAIINEQTSKEKSQNSSNTLRIPFLNKNLIEIVKRGNVFKLSCAEKYNKVNLKSNLLYNSSC